MTIREIYKNSEQFLNKEVKLGGWIRSIRGSKHFGFLVLHDGTFFKPIQVVYEEKLENFQEISKMNVGAAVIVEGTLVPTPQAKQPFEIQAATVTLEAFADDHDRNGEIGSTDAFQNCSADNGGISGTSDLCEADPQ